eukprot:g285.t1
MMFAVSLTSRPRPLRHLNTVAVCAKKNLGTNEKFTRRRKLPKTRDPSESDDKEEISVLYDNNPIPYKIIRGLVVKCNQHIDEYVKDGDLSTAEKLFKLMIKREVDPDAVTYNTLMNGYLKSGNYGKVFKLFDEMKRKYITPSSITFGIVIRACAQTGNLRRALRLFNRMKSDHELIPNEFIYSALLKVCITVKDLKIAQRIFEEMISTGIEVNNIILNTMIDVYAECCTKRNGKQYLKKCREILEDLGRTEVKANEQTYATLLKLCARVSLTFDAMDILEEMRNKGLRPSVVSYNTVIDGITKDKNLSNKEVLVLHTKITHAMKKEGIQQNTRTFNSLMRIALRLGSLNKAIEAFNQMKVLKLQPSEVTYGTLIKCYEKLGNSSKGKEYLKPCLDLFEECEQNGLKMGSEGYTSLLSACAKAPNIKEALRVWDKIQKEKIKPKTYLFNAMINACVCGGDDDKAVELFEAMKKKRLKPDGTTYATMIKCFEKFGDPSFADSYLKLCFDLYEECNQAGRRMDAEGMIEKNVKPDVFLYNALIHACSCSGDKNKAIEIFEAMKKEGLKPNAITFGTLIKCYGKLGDPSEGNDAYLKPCLDLFEECGKSGFNLTIEGYTSLLTACANASNLDMALKIWSKIARKSVKPSVSLYNAMINACVCGGDKNKAITAFAELKKRGLKPNAVSYAILIKCHEKLGDPTEDDAYLKPCLDLFEECEQSGLMLSAEGYTSLLSACAKMSNLEEAEKIWKKLLDKRVVKNTYLYNAMINCCLTGDKKERAFGLLNEMIVMEIKPDKVTYVIFMTHFAKSKDRSSALKIHLEMERLKVKPEESTLRTLRILEIV